MFDLTIVDIFIICCINGFGLIIAIIIVFLLYLFLIKIVLPAIDQQLKKDMSIYNDH